MNSNPPELWAFIIANTLLFVISSVLVVLSYAAYRQSDDRTSYLTATIGFVAVVLGGLVEPGYQLVVRGDFNIDGTELLWLQTAEGLLIAAGLGLIFYAVTHHGSEERAADEDAYKFGPQETDD
ncbi:DUF7521 family protein [Halopiger thermotolerans]